MESSRLRMAGYYNSLARLDDSVGQILEVLRESGRADNTLVIFLSDHGAHIGGSKLTNYEAGLKVPFILHAPGGPGGEV